MSGVDHKSSVSSSGRSLPEGTVRTGEATERIVRKYEQYRHQNISRRNNGRRLPEGGNLRSRPQPHTISFLKYIYSPVRLLFFARIKLRPHNRVELTHRIFASLTRRWNK